MNRVRTLSTLFALLFISAAAHAAAKPNILFILTDDQGYGDLSCMGAAGFETPAIDGLRKEGMLFTDFYVHNRCSPTRLAFMTGCLAKRAGFDKVIYKHSLVGINSEEITTAELLQQAGYRTMIVGKWHLGEWQKFNPIHHGFDQFYGFMDGKLLENEKVIEAKVSKTDGIHTPKLVKAGQAFIKEESDKPFFLFYSSPLPHTKWKPHPDFAGKSRMGIYGDVIQEIDWQVGQLLKTLEATGQKENTLVIYTSDNGPQLNTGEKGKRGSAGILLGSKWSNLEGGIRVPTIMRWPGKIKADTSNHQITAIYDLLPTFSEIAAVNIPSDRTLDGKSILPYLLGEQLDKPIHDLHVVPGNNIRMGHWKLRIKPHGYNNREGVKAVAGPGLFNLKVDPGEATDVSSKHPETAERLRKAMADFEADLKASTREIGKITDPASIKLMEEKMGAKNRKKAGKKKSEKKKSSKKNKTT